MSSLLKHLFRYIPIRRKKQLFLFLILTVFTSFAEVVSIGTIIPFLTVLTEPSTVFEYESAKFILDYFSISKPEQLLIPITIVFIFAVIFAGLMRIGLIWSQARLAQAIGADLSRQMYKKSLYQPYAIHIKRNSSEVIAAISSKVDQVVGQAILPMLNIVSSLFMVLVILVALVAINPLVSMGATLGFILIYIPFILFSKKKLAVNSGKISKNTNLTIKTLQEGLGGIRDILLDGMQEDYCKLFSSADVSRRRAMASNHIIANTPKYAIESIVIAMIAGVAYLMLGNGKNITDFLPILGALVLGVQRMLPMYQQIYAGLSNIRGSRALLQDSLIFLDQKLPERQIKPSSTKVYFNKKVSLQKLSFRYHKNTPWILKEIDLDISKGSKIGFIGKTGSGKSTLLDIVMALLYPTSGSLSVDGVEICKENSRSWQSNIAHIPQEIYLSDSTIAENIAFGLPKHQIDYNKVENSAHQAQLADVIESLEGGYDTVVGEQGIRLSGGQRQRIGIARALYKNSDVLIFDEATSALDTNTEKALIDTINGFERNITILMIAHRLSTLSNCDMIVELENGRLKRQCSYDEIIK